jgi:hypothetical protein
MGSNENLVPEKLTDNRARLGRRADRAPAQIYHESTVVY